MAIPYNYKYNGKELQEIGFLDYGWRQYMPDLGRWFGMDQLSESYLSTSPYAYVLNNPAMYNDVDGRLTEFKMAEDNEGLEFSKGLNSMLTTGSGASTDAWNSLSNLGNSNGNDYSEFGNTPAYQDAMSFLSGNNQGVFNLTNRNGRLTWWTDMQNTGISGDIQGLAGHTMKLNNSSSVGQPGEWESLIPVWGSGRAAVDHFQNGNYWTGAAYTALAVSDVFLVKSIATGIGKGGLIALTKNYKTWGSWRRLYGKEGFAEAGQHLHHWAWRRNGAKSGTDLAWKMKNQMWNLMPMKDPTFHRAIHGFGTMNRFERVWYGTPSWVKTGAFSTLGHSTQLGSYQFNSEDY